MTLQGKAHALESSEEVEMHVAGYSGVVACFPTLKREGQTHTPACTSFFKKGPIDVSLPPSSFSLLLSPHLLPSLFPVRRLGDLAPTDKSIH